MNRILLTIPDLKMDFFTKINFTTSRNKQEASDIQNMSQMI